MKGGKWWLLAALVLLSLWIFQTFQEESVTSTRTADGVTSAPSDPLDLRLEAWVDDQRVTPMQKVSFWISIHNPTDMPVLVSFADVKHPGFTPSGKCWIGGFPSCRTAGGQQIPIRYPIVIPEQGTSTIAAELEASDEPGRYAISAVVEWHVEPLRVTRRKPIALKPIAIESRLTKYTLIALRGFRDFVKDLGLSIALAFLGYWLKKLEDTRAEKREQEDDTRMRQRNAAADRSAQMQQTWNLMMMKSHQNAERHYMPTITAARRVSSYWKRAASKPAGAERAEQLDLCFFSFLLFLSRMSRMSRLIGGFYFKNRKGEVVAKNLWTWIINWADQNLGRTVREKATAALPPHYTYAQYVALGPNHADIQAFSAAFDAHLGDFQRVVLVLDALVSVMEFEINRPYTNWYGKEEELDAQAAGATLLRMLQAGPEMRELAAEFDQYVHANTVAQTVQ